MINLKCKCGYAWTYKGKKKYKVTCPDCTGAVYLKKIKKKDKLSDQLNRAKPNSSSESATHNNPSDMVYSDINKSFASVGVGRHEN